MLKGLIRLDDLERPVLKKGRAFLFGESYVEPFTHNLLRQVIVQRKSGFDLLSYENSLLVQPDDFRQWTESGSFSELQRVLDRAGVDYLLLRTAPALRMVQFISGQIGTAPVYLTLVENNLWFSWSFNDVVKRSSQTLDMKNASAFLTATINYGTHTLFRDVYRVASGTTFSISPGLVSIVEPEHPAGFTVSPLQDTADPRELLFRGMRSVFKARALDCRTTAAEISGGMDSAIAALALSDAYGPGLRSSGAIFDGDMGVAQQLRRELVIAKGGYSDLPIRAAEHAPYGARSVRRIPPGVYPEDENYPELFEYALERLSEAGVDTLISGQGGDELYPFYASEAGHIPVYELRNSKILTPKTYKLSAERRSRNHNPRLLQSCWISSAGRAERSLRHGIWPIYVYYAPQIASYTFRLPFEWRNNRSLHSKTLTWILGNNVFETDYLKEKFTHLYRLGISENRESLFEIFAEPILADFGLIDARAVSNVVRDPQHHEDDLRSLFFVLNLELYLRNLSAASAL